jgi:hypothetical protein
MENSMVRHILMILILRKTNEFSFFVLLKNKNKFLTCFSCLIVKFFIKNWSKNRIEMKQNETKINNKVR